MIISLLETNAFRSDKIGSMPNAPIKIQDVVYGEFTINHPLIIQIVNSPPMQRLKAIDMAGYSDGYYPGSQHSRFEHSLGVYHLLSRHNASLEECIHGLLHDISHTAFSHAVDYALADASGKNQDFQDRVFHSFVADTEIPKILKDFGLDPEFVFDEENFPLQETTIPDLCADRLDYSLRGFYHYKTLPLSEIKKIVLSLRNNDKEWFFDCQESAQYFASAFADIDDKVFDSLHSAAMLRAVGDCLKYAFDHGILSRIDLFSTDQEAIAKLKANLQSDRQLEKLWARMNGRVPYKNDENDYESVVFCKSRIVDPKFLAKTGSLIRLSDVSPAWRSTVVEGLKHKTYYLKFLD